MSEFLSRRVGVSRYRLHPVAAGRRFRVGRRLAIELLEGRALLSLLDLASASTASPLSYFGGFTGSSGLTISVADTVSPPSVRNYTFNDPDNTITLGTAAIAAGWTTIDANTVTGPASSVSNMNIFFQNIININSIDAPISVNDSSSVNIGNGTVQGIAGAVSIANSSTTSSVTVNDSSDLIGQAATLSETTSLQGQLLGLVKNGIFFSPTNLSALTIDTGSGGNSLTVDFSNGTPLSSGFPGLVFNGGSAGDTLNLVGDPGFLSESFFADGPGAGTIFLDDNSIGFTGLKVVNDLVPVPTLTFSVPSGPQSYAILDGPTIGTLATTQITSTATVPGFAQTNLFSKGVVTVNTQNGEGIPGDQAVTINIPTAVPGITALNLTTSDGNNTVDLIALPPGLVSSISLGNGSSAINVASAGLSTTGSTTVSGGSGTDTMTYDANGSLVTVTPTSISAGTGSALFSTVAFNHIALVRIVNSPDLPLTTTPVSLNTTAGTPLIGVIVATFSDTDPFGKLGDFTASIDWGDGTTTPADSIVASSGGNFDVLGTHTYNVAGPYTIMVTINDQGSSYVLTNPISGPFTVIEPGGASVTAQTPVVVTSTVPPTLTGIPVAATEGQPFDGAVASFTLGNSRFSPSLFQARIDWGDGTPNTAGTISQPGGPGTAYVVNGSHTYNMPGSFPVTATVSGPIAPAGTTATTATVAADLTVYNTRDDSNPGSLRHAINEVNASLGTLVTFRIPGDGPFAIAPATPLPALLRPAFIDATTQPGFNGNPLVILSGAGLAGDNNDGLTIEGGNTTVKGLEINGFSGVGVVLENQGGDTLQSDYIGTDATGTRAVPNFQGVLILGTSDNMIGGVGTGQGNLISGNLSAGIQIFNNQAINDPTQHFDVTGPASRNSILGNLIGTNAAGTAPLGNQQGVFINDAPDTLIGGSAPRAGNVISGNRSVGLQILGPDASGTVVLNNAIGVDRTRTQALVDGSGVFVFASPSNMSQSEIEDRNNVQPSGVRIRPRTDGPTVGSVVALPATGATINHLTISFTMYLDRTRASNTANYEVRLFRRNLITSTRIPVVSATYNGIYRNVDLVLGAAIPRDSTFQLRIIGTIPNGLTDTSGNTLDGNASLFRLSTGTDNITTFRQGRPSQPGELVAFGKPNQHKIKAARAQRRDHNHKHSH